MKSLLLVAALLSGAQAFAAKGTDHGNGTDHSELVFPGAHKNVPVDPETLPEPQKLVNKLVIQNATISLSPTAQANAMVVFNTADVLGKIQLPSSSGKLDSLYHTALKNRGDFSDLKSAQNPFAPYVRDEYYSKDIYDIDKWAATLDPAFRTQNLVASLQDMTLDLNVQMNPELTNGKCGACTADDFARLPGQGITMKVVCRVGRSPEFDVPGAQITLTSSTQSVHKVFDILPAAYANVAANWVKQQICSQPDEAKWDTDVTCGLRPATADQNAGQVMTISQGGDTYRWSDITYNDVWFASSRIEFVNPDKVQKALSIASGVLKPQTTDHDGNIETGMGFIPTFGLFAHTSTDAYTMKIESNPLVSVSYANQKADIAQFVKNTLLNSYGKIQKDR